MKTKKSFGKRILSLLLTLLMVLSLIPLSSIQGFATELETESVGASIKPYDGVPVTPQKVDSNNYSQLGFTSTGYGEYNGWYAIRDAKEFYGFANLVNNNGEYKAKAVLVNDIVVNKTVSSSGANYSWTPIGSLNDPFEGVLDGRGCTVSGIYINGYSEIGLFGCVGKGSAENKPTVKNLILSNSYISGSNCYVGGIAGRLFGTDTVISKCKIDSNVTIESRFTGEEAYIGGITGHCFGNMLSNKHSQINDCVVLGKVKAPNSLYYIGAIAGMYHENTIPSIVATNCYYIEGNVTNKKGVTNIGLGCKYNQANYGCTKIKSINDSHTCVEVERKETVANCKYDGMTAHTFCLICGKVLSGTKSVTQNPDDHLVIDKNGFCPDCGGYEKPKQNTDGVYEIDNAGKLYWFAQQVNNGSKDINAILTADIVVNAGTMSAKTDSTKVRHWTPIGNSTNMYTGKFNGNNHTISGLYFNNTALANVGFVGYLGTSNGTVNNVGIINSYFNGESNVGSVVGYNAGGSITRCYSTGNVNGKFSVGGIVGYSYAGSITRCYNTGNVNGEENVGGIVGSTYYSGFSSPITVTNCYNIGAVSGEFCIGAIVGNNYGIISNCYYLADSETDEYYDTTFKTADQFASGEVAYLLGESFGQKIGTDKYPVFSGDKVYCLYIDCVASEKIYSNSPEYDGEVNHHYENGFCKSCGSYEPAIDSNNDGYCEIDNAGKLYWYAENINNSRSNYKAILTADITVNEGIVDENSTNARKWIPIGTNNDGYSRTFDGNGKTISGLYCNDSSSNNIGFIDNLNYYGTVKNLNIKNSYFSGNKQVGGIVSANAGKVENCTFSGIVKGQQEVGGIIGDNYITDSLTTNCYSSGKVIGDSFVGGVMGYNMGTVKYCYSTSEVVAEDGSGVIGYSYNKPVNCCYYLNTSCNGGINGKDIAGQAEAKTAEQFASGEVAYLLGDAWGQKIGTDKYPVLGGDKVYYGYESLESTTPIYSNKELIDKSNYEPAVDSDGDGYIEIDTTSKLFWFAMQINTGALGAHKVKLTADIEIPDSRKWIPINFPDGASNSSVFDGNGHSITMNQNFDTGTTDGNSYGLFTKYNYSIVENLVLKGSITANTTGNVGAVSASSYRTTFRNIVSYMNVTNNCNTEGNTGGLVGYFGGQHSNGLYSLIENCAVYADITGYTAGGFVGKGWNGSQYYDITNCAYIGDVEGHNAGAIVGYLATDSNTSRFTNIYWSESHHLGFYGLRDTENQIYTNTEEKKLEQFENGEVAYLLGEAWGQKIGADKKPVLGGDKVYYGYDGTNSTEKTYGNSPLFEEPVKLGDIDLDGKVSIKDATLLSKHLVGRAKLNDVQLSVSDVNNDGAINIIDATQIQKILVRA